MVALACPACQDVEAVVPFSLNRSGTRRYWCKTRGKTFTPAGRPRRLSDEKRESIEGALAERISQHSHARVNTRRAAKGAERIAERGPPCLKSLPRATRWRWTNMVTRA